MDKEKNEKVEILSDGTEVKVVDGKVETPQPAKVEDKELLEHRRQLLVFYIEQGKKAEQDLLVLGEKINLIK